MTHPGLRDVWSLYTLVRVPLYQLVNKGPTQELQDWSNNRSIGSCFDLSGAVLKVPLQESQGSVGF